MVNCKMSNWVHTKLLLVGEDTNHRSPAVAGVPIGHSIKQKRQFGMHPAIDMLYAAPDAFYL